ncbi:MAG: hypothetical protein U0359_34385 [Byssovorax sp.]
MQRRPGPTIPDSSLGGSDTPSLVGSAPTYTRPSLAQGKPSSVRTAGSSFVAIAGGAIALLLVLGGIAALVAYLVDPRLLDLSTGKPPAKAAISAKGAARPSASSPAPAVSAAKTKPSR